VLKTLDEENIHPIVLSGAALIETVYTNPAQRPMADIDLLVKPEDLTKLDFTLQRIGYTGKPALGNNEVHYSSPQSYIPEVTLDIQTSLWHLTQEELNKVWQSVREIYLDDTKALVLSSEDMLIYSLADTIVYHGFLSPIWLNDIKQIINRYETELDWEIILSKIRQYHLRIPVYLVLKRMVDLGEIRIPEWILTRLKPRYSDHLKVRFYQVVLEGPPINLIGAFIRFFTMREGKGQFKFFLRYIFPTRHSLIDRYRLTKQPALYPLFWFLRPVKHFWKASVVGWQIFSRTVGGW